MGVLEHWDERNQRTAEWQQEVGRRNPRPAVGKRVGTILGAMAILGLVGSLAAPLIGDLAWIAVLTTLAVVCGAIAYMQAKRQRRDWESDRS